MRNLSWKVPRLGSGNCSNRAGRIIRTPRIRRANKLKIIDRLKALKRLSIKLILGILGIIGYPKALFLIRTTSYRASKRTFDWKCKNSSTKS